MTPQDYGSKSQEQNVNFFGSKIYARATPTLEVAIISSQISNNMNVDLQMQYTP
jgi:hypothetical protein